MILLADDSIFPTTIPTPWAGVTDTALQGLLFLLPGLVTVAIVHSLTVKQKQEPLERVIQALLYTFINHVTWQIALLSIDAALFCVSLGHHWLIHNPWQPTAKAQLIGLGFCAFIWGIVITWIVNIGWLHDKLRNFKWAQPCFKWLRDKFKNKKLVGGIVERFCNTQLAQSFYAALCFGITKRSSRPSEWYDAFWEADDKYAVINLKDERRIYGWVHLYPDLPTEGHLLIRDAEWLIDPPSSEPSLTIDPGTNLPVVTFPAPKPVESNKDSTPPAPMDILIDVTQVEFIEFVRVQSPTEQNHGDGTTTTGGEADHKERGREPEASGATPACAPSTPGS